MPLESSGKESKVELDAARQFIREHHHAILAAYRRAGPVQMSPVVVGIDEAGRAVVSTREPLYKVRHLRKDPRVSLCVFENSFFGKWIQIDGTAAILSLPDAMEPLVDLYRSVAGEHSDWDDYRRAMIAEERVLIRITIEKAGPG
jgi:PPOX class probable F420-dependent enzyme